MTLRQVIYRVEVPTGGTGQSGITDSIGLYARVNLADTITTTATDALALAVHASYADSAAAQADAVGLYAKVSSSDTAPGQSDAITGITLTGDESNAAPSDALTALRMVLTPEGNPSPLEFAKVGFAGSDLSDTMTPMIDARPTTTVHTWAASQTSAGGGTTNGANAVGAANGTIANVTGTGLGGTSTLTLTIPVASVPANGAKTLRCYVAFTSSLSTATATFTNTGGSPASGTVPVANGAVIGTPTSVAITTVGTSFTVQFLVNSAALLAPTYSVDAVEIQTVSVI